MKDFALIPGEMGACKDSSRGLRWAESCINRIPVAAMKSRLMGQGCKQGDQGVGRCSNSVGWARMVAVEAGRSGCVLTR